MILLQIALEGLLLKASSSSEAAVIVPSSSSTPSPVAAQLEGLRSESQRKPSLDVEDERKTSAMGPIADHRDVLGAEDRALDCGAGDNRTTSIGSFRFLIASWESIAILTRLAEG